MTPPTNQVPASPPPASPPARPVAAARRSQLMLGLALVPIVFFAAVILLRLLGLISPYVVPTGSMTPAVSAGDQVMVEAMTFLRRQPRRGDVVLFKSDGITLLPPGEVYFKRVAGAPGERLRIAGGKLFINDQPVALSNARGEIVYASPPGLRTLAANTNVTVSPGSFFVLGDNSTNSLDSRFWGDVPRTNITGRVWFCYWPPARIGFVK